MTDIDLARAAEMLAASQAAMAQHTGSMADSLAAFGREVATLRTEVANVRTDVTELQRMHAQILTLWRWALGVAVAVCVLVLIGLTTLAFILSREAQTLGLVKSAVTPGGQIYENGKTDTNGKVATIVLETECRVRRIVLGLPPAPENAPCRGLPDNPPTH